MFKNINFGQRSKAIFYKKRNKKNKTANQNLGNLNLQTNLKVHNFDTNKHTKFLINDVDWKYRNFNFNSGLSGKILGN